MHMTLFQPRYPHGRIQTYMSGSLMNLGSRLLSCGVDVSFADLNHTTLDSSGTQEKVRRSDHVGFTVLGPPYIPTIARNIATLRDSGFAKPILLGGEGVTRLRSSDFSAWFDYPDVQQHRTDEDVVDALGLSARSLPSMFDTSMRPMLERLSEEERRRYLTSEFSLFISYGCKFNCRFCAAAKAMRERYRDLAGLEDEVEYICHYLDSIGHPVLRVYLSSLDIFQTAENLDQYLATVSRICRKYRLQLDARGLATSRCTVEACRADPELPRRLAGYGLTMVSFGADGADEETWARENKKHNTVSELVEAVRFMRAGKITPELLMIFGFPEDRWKQVWTAIKFSLKHAMKGVIIRPYLAKSVTPSGFWEDDNTQVQAFVQNRDLLIKLDYAMLGSAETHPSWWQRQMVNIAYLGIISSLTPLRLCGTRPLFPAPQRGIMRKTVARTLNRFMPFDR